MLPSAVARTPSFGTTSAHTVSPHCGIRDADDRRLQQRRSCSDSTFSISAG